ncbi:MAG: RHS repeat-associated core domain-containing protein [Phycisphaerae bacterium]
MAASYAYDAFGNITAQSGSYADANPFRFSTKYFDAETGLSYYGYRYYSARLGRWLSRRRCGSRTRRTIASRRGGGRLRLPRSL